MPFFYFDQTHLPLLLLYAEIHYRFFPFFPSMLFRKEPEIIFDAPRRIESDHDLPVVLVVHDLKKYPTELGNVQITVSQINKKPSLFKFEDITQNEINHPLSHQLKTFLFIIPRQNLSNGEIFVNASITITKGKSTKQVLNDNLYSSSKLPFKCFVTSSSIPGSSFCSFGDLHNHSIYSQSHVEFGPPLKIIDLFAKVSGLSFVGITDHSYDLACNEENYLVQDQSLRRWKLLSEEFNGTFQSIMFQGEEVSCLNKKGKVVHLCGLGQKSFIPGSLDGARPNKFFKSLTIPEVIDTIHSEGGICFAAHPGSQAGYLQSLFLHRGIWSENDITEKLDGFQALNSGFRKSWNRGKELWIKMLQKGYRIPLLAGNDAHGDFNRYRAIGKPFINIHEDFQRFMGYGKTAVYGANLSADQILNQIRNGMTFITTGPYISLNYNDSPLSTAISKTTLHPSVTHLKIHAISSPEFGRVFQISILGSHHGCSETKIYSKTYKETLYETTESISIEHLPRPSYLRAEISCIKEDHSTSEAYTSACFLPS